MDEGFEDRLFRAMDGAIEFRDKTAHLLRSVELIALGIKAKATERFGLAFLFLALLCSVSATYVAQAGSITTSSVLWCTCLMGVVVGAGMFVSGNRRSRANADELLAIASAALGTRRAG